MNKLLLIIPVVIAIMVSSCQTIRTDSDGTPNDKGKYETKKLCGVTYSREALVSDSQKADESIIRFLKIVFMVGVIGLIGGIASLILDKTKRLPCPWWDELIAISLITMAVAIVSIKLYYIFMWIVIGAVAAYGVYLAWKAFRINKEKQLKGYMG